MLMKKFLFMLFFVLGYSALILADEYIYCDTIFLKDNQTIIAKAKDISPNQITYVMCDYQDGQTFTMPMQEIVKINFANGKLLIVQKESDNIPISPIVAENNQQDKEQNSVSFVQFVQNEKQKDNDKDTLNNVEELKNVFQANFDIAGIFGINRYSYSLGDETSSGGYVYGGSAIDAIFGIRLRKFAFVGAGISFQTTFHNFNVFSYDIQEVDMLLPLFANAKLYYPTKININPYLDVNIGGYIGLPSKAIANDGNIKYEIKDKLPDGFYFRVGAGLEIKRFNIGVGYQLCKPKVSNPSHIGYVKLGIRVGKM